MEMENSENQRENEDKIEEILKNDEKMEIQEQQISIKYKQAIISNYY